ncbi:helix-turn-helix domain-containing protein [Arthrobacter sp. NPDC058127]|uniref:helix-turn-helix domain-containing protein n=1 Tax=Arthrobacter sp. NPDC058127 TaxID=3346351 RepID=UPI0036EFD9D1
MTSARMATVPLGDTTPYQLAQVVHDEAARLFGSDDAALWIHDPVRSLIHPYGQPEETHAVPVPLDFRVDVDGLREASTSEGWGRIAAASFGSEFVTAPGRLWVLPFEFPEKLLAGIVLLGARRAFEPRNVPPEDTLSFTRQTVSLLANHLELTAARRNQDRLNALYKTAGEMSSHLDVDVVLRTIIGNACKLLSAPIGYIMLVDPADSHIFMRAAEGTQHPEFQRLRLQLGAGLGGVVAQHHSSFFTEDYLNDKRINHHPVVDNAVRQEGIRSILGSPMSMRGEFVGVLYVADQRVRHFSDDEIALLEGLALHAGLSIENARLYERDTAALRELRKSSEIIRAQNDLLMKADAAQKRLSATLLASEGLPGIAAVVQELIHAPTLILDSHHQRLAGSGEPRSDIGRTIWERGVTPKLAGFSQIRRTLTDLGRTTRPEPPSIPKAGSNEWQTVPVHAGHEFLGSIWVFPNEPLDETDQPILERAAISVALEMLRERSVFEAGQRLRRNLVDEILSESTTDQSVVNRWAGQLGFQLSGKERLCVVKSSSDVTHALDAAPWCLFSTKYRDNIVALLAPDADLVPKVGGLLHAASAPGRSPHAVISSPLAPGQTYRMAYRLSQRVLDLLGSENQARVIDLDRARVLALLFREGDRETARHYVEACLGAVIARDPAGDLDLVMTLDAYLASGHRPTPAAKALHVHVNTVYYRLTLLTEILGDIRDPVRALDLQVACLVYRLLKGD